MFLESYPHSQGRWSIFRAVCRSMVVSASCCNLVVGVVGVAASWSVLQSRGRHGFCCKIMVGDVSVADPWSTWFLLQNHGRLDFFLQNHGWRQYLLQIYGRVYFCCSTMVANYFLVAAPWQVACSNKYLLLPLQSPSRGFYSLKLSLLPML